MAVFFCAISHDFHEGSNFALINSEFFGYFFNFYFVIFFFVRTEKSNSKRSPICFWLIDFCKETNVRIRKSCQLTSFKLVVIVFMYFQLYKSQEIYKSTSVVLTSLIEEARIQTKYLQIR